MQTFLLTMLNEKTCLFTIQGKALTDRFHVRTRNRISKPKLDTKNIRHEQRFVQRNQLYPDTE